MYSKIVFPASVLSAIVGAFMLFATPWSPPTWNFWIWTVPISAFLGFGLVSSAVEKKDLWTWAASRVCIFLGWFGVNAALIHLWPGKDFAVSLLSTGSILVVVVLIRLRRERAEFRELLNKIG